MTKNGPWPTMLAISRSLSKFHVAINLFLVTTVIQQISSWTSPTSVLLPLSTSWGKLASSTLIWVLGCLHHTIQRALCTLSAFETCDCRYSGCCLHTILIASTYCTIAMDGQTTQGCSKTFWWMSSDLNNILNCYCIFYRKTNILHRGV